MSTFDGEALVSRFNDVWDNHDVDGIIDQFADDVVFEASFGPEPYGDRATGKDEARALVERVFERIPDYRFKEIRHVVTDDHAVIESATTGTPADGGQPFDVHIVDILTLRDGKITGKRSYRKARL